MINYLWFIPAIIVARVQWNRLKFKKYKISASEQEIYKALDLTVQELNWRIHKRTPDYIKASRSWEFTVGWGEMITILPAKGSVMVNSISSTASFGMNRTNTRTFIINLYNIVNGTSMLKPEEREKRWSLGNTIFRVIAYPFCIGLILLSVFEIIPSGEITLGIASIVMSVYYLYTDLALFKRSD